MEKVLVTGAAGAIGQKVIKYLLSEGKYEITAIDLRNKNNFKKLKRYRRRINIIYGDINDRVLVDALVKDQDYIIHLASVMPPLADIKKDLSYMVEYKGTENIIKAIDFYNPDCFLVYASSATIYGPVETASVKSEAKLTELDYYSNNKIKTEELITKKLKKYTIIRIPLVLCNPSSGSFMYNMKLDTYVEAITDNDAAYMLVRALSYQDKLNKKVFNAGGGDSLKDLYGNILMNVLNIYGLSFKYLLNLFIDKNFYGQVYLDSDKLEEILDFRSDSLASYYMRLKRSVKKTRLGARILAKPVIGILKLRFMIRKKFKKEK